MRGRVRLTPDRAQFAALTEPVKDRLGHSVTIPRAILNPSPGAFGPGSLPLASEWQALC